MRMTKFHMLAEKIKDDKVWWKPRKLQKHILRKMMFLTHARLNKNMNTLQQDIFGQTNFVMCRTKYKKGIPF